MKYKTIEKYIEKQFEKEGMEISDEAVQRISEEITVFLNKITKDMLLLRNHKTIMERDVMAGLFCNYMNVYKYLDEKR